MRLQTGKAAEFGKQPQYGTGAGHNFRHSKIFLDIPKHSKTN